MEYHRWQETGRGYECKRCGVSQRKKAHITSCPPTWFEMTLIDKINYGDFRTIDTEFDGLLSILNQG